MIDRKKKNIKIFRDTVRRYHSQKQLKKAVQESLKQQKFIAARTDVRIPQPTAQKKAVVIVSEKRSLEAATVYAEQGKKVCVLNFASAVNPGGGVMNGASAQEECICRCTTLYPCLNSTWMWNMFYLPHRYQSDSLHNNDCIYTPNVCIFKSDIDFPKPLWKKHWQYVNILTCAAPRLIPTDENSMGDLTASELEALLTARIQRIFEIAVREGNEVLILGAFGCGAFKNPPEIVAKVFYHVMQDYLCYFDVIEYAVYHTEHERANYEAFSKTFLKQSS